MTSAYTSLIKQLALTRNAQVTACEHIDANAYHDVLRVLVDRPFVWFTGVGKSGLVARRACDSLTSLGKRCAYVHATELLHGGLGAVAEDHALFAVSRSGESSEVVRVFHEADTQTRVAVAPRTSRLGHLATILLDLEFPPDVDAVIPLESLAVQTLLLDGLIAAFRDELHVTSSDVANHHPGGELGKRGHS